MSINAPESAAYAVPTPVISGTSARAAGDVPDTSRLVTRDETTTHNIVPSHGLALVDWLCLTVYPAEGRDWRWLRDCLKFIFEIPPEAWRGTNKSWSGYKHRVDLIHPGQRGESIHLGLVGYGGESQRGTMHVSLNATACARVKDWQQVMEWGESVGAVITRVDCAHDDFESKVLSIKQARQWFLDGLFTTSGRPPKPELIDDLGTGGGKTFYVGRRGNGKYTRFYEKGKKEGDPDSLWMRVEVEFKNKSRVIPWEIVIYPGRYLAGAFPCLAYLSEQQSRIKTIRKSATINYERMVKNIKTSSGKGLNVMLQVEGSPDAVLELVRRDGAPKRLEPYVGIEGAIEGSDDGSPKP